MGEPQASDLKNWRNGWKNKGKKFLEFKEQVKYPIRKLAARKTAEVGVTVLDVGCATCSDYPYHRNRGTKYMGRDFTEKFIRRARSRFPDVDVAYGDVLNLDFPDGSVDVVYCKDLLEHLPPDMYRQAVGEMWRVARKRVMVAFFLAPIDGETQYRILKGKHWNNTYSRSDIVLAFTDLGADNMEIVEGVGYNRSALYVVDKP